METKSVVSRERIEIIADLIAAAFFLGAGLLLMALKVDFNSRAVIASSFIPLAMAGGAWYKIWAIRKYPKQMRPLIVSLQDERLAAARSQANAITFDILQWMLKLLFISYTLMVPDDIFESFGWWIVFALFFLSTFLPVIALKFTAKEDVRIDD